MGNGTAIVFALAALLLLAFMPVSRAASLNLSPTATQSGAFINGNVVTITYSGNYICSPSIAKIYPNISRISNITTCGVRLAGNILGTLPVWAIVPYFARFSIYGYLSYNSTSAGFPTYNGNAIITDCGAGASRSPCADTPSYRYAPNQSVIERAYGIYNGIGGLPQGLLPMPAYSYILLSDYGGVPIPWYLVFVRVYDPNIFPNATTGTCKQVAPSNLSNPTGNCLTSFDAIRRASATKNSYIPTINANNPFWVPVGNTLNQLEITLASNVTGISSILYPNSNIYLTFAVNHTNFYAQALNLSIANQVNVARAQSNSTSLKIIGAIVIEILLINFWWFFIRKRLKPKKPEFQVRSRLYYEKQQ